MKLDLNQKIVLITGASSGIGAATAIEFAKKNAFVLLLARNQKKLENVVAEIKNMEGKAAFFVIDISDFKAVKQLANEIITEYGTPDIIINNAGQGIWKFIEETTYEEMQQQMAVPYFGAFYVTKAFLPEMKKRNSGMIVNMTSYAGFIAFAGATAYISARTAMVGFHKALSADLYSTRIKTSLAYFAKVSSNYWENNPGSEERLPGAQRLIPVISPQKAAQAIVKGVEKQRTRITAPGMIYVMNFVIRYLPWLANFLLNKSGFKPR